MKRYEAIVDGACVTVPLSCSAGVETKESHHWHYKTRGWHWHWQARAWARAPPAAAVIVMI